MNNTGT